MFLEYRNKRLVIIIKLFNFFITLVVVIATATKIIMMLMV